MKRLYILRHAKSSWDDASLADFDRPLNDRGRESAPLMGRLMRDRGYIPDVAIASPAKRAKKTAKLALEAADINASILFDERVYEASTQTLVNILSGVDDKAESAMIVGHNPGMEGLVRTLTGESQEMPTAALAVIDLNVDSWARVGHETGTLIEVLRPKELGNLR